MQSSLKRTAQHTLHPPSPSGGPSRTDRPAQNRRLTWPDFRPRLLVALAVIVDQQTTVSSAVARKDPAHAHLCLLNQILRRAGVRRTEALGSRDAFHGAPTVHSRIGTLGDRVHIIREQVHLPGGSFAEWLASVTDV